MYAAKIENLVNAITFQFNNRTAVESKKRGTLNELSLDISFRDNNKVVVMKFSKLDESYTVTFPVPYIENGIEFINSNEVVRPICRFWLESSQSEVDFIAVLNKIILGNTEDLLPKSLYKKTPFIQLMVYGFNNGNASIIAHKMQKAINEVVNMMPLHETDMNSFIMNSRLVIVDHVFNELNSPEDRLRYQVDKSRKYFSKGWTSIGLSDGVLADKNYILKKDLRYYSPFGIRFHNPQRNLYSTLGMKGDELPRVRSRSMQNLLEYGITRHGWNMFTAFVDVPEIFEDQIIVDNVHKNKYVDYKRKFLVFGKVIVKEGDYIKTGKKIGISPDGVPVKFEVLCDSAHVVAVKPTTAIVGNAEENAHHVIISYRRFFCDGFKFTNLHGNKGIIRMMDLGYAIDPVTGEERKIDVIVGAKTIGKRKNYGQIMEALLNCVAESDKTLTPWDIARAKFGFGPSKKIDPIILEDDWYQPIDQVKAGLKRRGYNEEGTWECNTHFGKLKAVCGTVFWGVIKTPQDQLWRKDATIRTNNKEMRKAGLKFSHIEFRGLETRFGKENPVVDEIMSYMQGSDNVKDFIDVLKSRRGIFNRQVLTHTLNSVDYIRNEVGTIVDQQFIAGTVVDDTFAPTGFYFQLPKPYMTIEDVDDIMVYEGAEIDPTSIAGMLANPIKNVYVTDRIYFPAGHLRKCWRHDTGKFGLSELGVAINNIIVMSHRMIKAESSPETQQIFGKESEVAISNRLYVGAISNYFSEVTSMLSGKNGEISNSTMSVRYPFSVKAVATLSTSLPKGTVEIHRNMANDLMVENGKVVLGERFPCLGFVSLPVAKVRITDDPMCKYTIRVSNNDFVSTNLDFDGDTFYLASFHTPEAIETLTREWTNPNKTCHDELERMNNRKGAPRIKEFTLSDFNITPFDDLNVESHAVIVEKNTGVKAQTGPVIALTYNIMRIAEDSDLMSDHKSKVALELFVEKAAQSVFEQKHGGVSLHEIVIDGICKGDIEKLVEVGFKRGITEKLINLVGTRAAELGISDLAAYHEKIKQNGRPNIIHVIVRQRNRIYYVSRSSSVGESTLLEALEHDAVDIPSRMFKWAMATKLEKVTMLDKVLDGRKIEKLKSTDRALCSALFELIDKNMRTIDVN